MTMQQYLINKGFDERTAFYIAYNYRSAKDYHTKAIVAYIYGQVGQLLISNWNQGDKRIRKALDHLVWKKMKELM